MRIAFPSVFTCVHVSPNSARSSYRQTYGNFERGRDPVELVRDDPVHAIVQKYKLRTRMGHLRCNSFCEATVRPLCFRQKSRTEYYDVVIAEVCKGLLSQTFAPTTASVSNQSNVRINETDLGYRKKEDGLAPPDYRDIDER